MAKTVAKTNLLLKITQHLPKLGAEINKDDFFIQEQTRKSWQDMVDILAELCGVSVAVIARSVLPKIDIICSSNTDITYYQQGASQTAEGSFLGEVLKNRSRV